RDRSSPRNLHRRSAPHRAGKAEDGPAPARPAALSRLPAITSLTSPLPRLQAVRGGAECSPASTMNKNADMGGTAMKLLGKLRAAAVALSGLLLVSSGVAASADAP